MGIPTILYHCSLFFYGCKKWDLVLFYFGIFYFTLLPWVSACFVIHELLESWIILPFFQD